MLARGFEIIDVEVRDITKRFDKATSPEDIRDALNNRIYRKEGQKVATIDVKEALESRLVDELLRVEFVCFDKSFCCFLSASAFAANNLKNGFGIFCIELTFAVLGSTET